MSRVEIKKVLERRKPSGNILLTGTLLLSLTAAGCSRGRPESTPEVPTPTPVPLPTVEPRPTETPLPKVNPTPTAVVINLPPVIGGVEPRVTPTPDVQRENLAQKAADYYLKNPLIDTLNNRPLSGVIVSERGSNDNLLISIRTLKGETLENSVLAGNWGYFALDEKNEVTGIVWAKQDTFKDSQGRIGYLGDSTLATTGAGWFGMEKMGYWTKDKKLIATVDPKTGEPVSILATVTPTLTKEPTETPEPRPVLPTPTRTPPLPTPIRPTATPEMPKAVFCPGIPAGFWYPFNGPVEAGIRNYFRHDLGYLVHGQIGDQGRRNPDGSITTRIKFNLKGLGFFEADYIIPGGLTIKKIINGVNAYDDAPQITAEEVCVNDMVQISSPSSPDIIDPRIPGTHRLDGPIYIYRYPR